jgi:hypothetical protein
MKTNKNKKGHTGESTLNAALERIDKRVRHFAPHARGAQRAAISLNLA